MAYATTNFKSKKELKEAIAAGKKIGVFSPGFFVEQNGTVFLEGPHYPQAHKWYAQCEVVNGVLTKAK